MGRGNSSDGKITASPELKRPDLARSPTLWKPSKKAGAKAKPALKSRKVEQHRGTR